MPDISRYERIIQDLENGKYRTLGLSVGHHIVSPGVKIDKKDTEHTPRLSAPDGLPLGVYTVIAVDLDGPFVSWNVASPTAHWIQTGLEVKQPKQQFKSSDPTIAPWAPAGPPPGAAPHRYLFLLYKQGQLSAVPSEMKTPITIFQRIRMDVDAMAKTLGLEEIAAVNYFTSN